MVKIIPKDYFNNRSGVVIKNLISGFLMILHSKLSVKILIKRLYLISSKNLYARKYWEWYARQLSSKILVKVSIYFCKDSIPNLMKIICRYTFYFLKNISTESRLVKMKVTLEILL
jgi:hypothetical protein